MMREIRILTLFVLLPLFGMSQFYTIPGRKKINRHELILGVGIMNYVGELGGGDGPGKTLFFRDVDVQKTRPTVETGFRFNAHKHLSFKALFSYGRVSGDDALTEYPERQYRNLSFSSNILEGGAYVEYFIIRANSRPTYLFRSTTRGNNIYSLYLFGGVSAFRFNPIRDGVALQPLGTEGQGFAGQPDFYSLNSWAIPSGIGFSYRLNGRIKIDAVFSYRKTFTDYLDDTSTLYYDAAALASRNPGSDLIADPSSGEIPGWTTTGAIRGNPETMNAFFSFSGQISYNLFEMYHKRRFNPKF